MKILYATKCWAGDIKDVFGYHPHPDIVIGNNLGFDFVDIGATEEPYYLPEKTAVEHAANCGASHILWFASDVKPKFDVEVFKSVALPLLTRYPIVSPFWDEDFSSFTTYAKREYAADPMSGFEETNFGFEDHLFSDHAYLAKIETMLNVDYEADHRVKKLYPQHGGNSFECRVGQWLASTGQKRAVLKDFHYKHTRSTDK